MTKMLRPLASATLLALAVPAHATITIVTSQAAFTAATSNQATDTFDNVPYDFLGTTLKRTAGSYGYTVSAPHGLDGDSGNADQWLTVDNYIDALTFKAFSGGVAGVGGSFFGTTASGAYNSAAVVVTATDADGTVTTTLPASMVNSFIGFVSTKSITQLTAKAVQPGTSGTAWVGANDLVLASAAVQLPSPVPEPATWAMVVIGFGVVGAGLRGRRCASLMPSP